MVWSKSVYWNVVVVVIDHIPLRMCVNIYAADILRLMSMKHRSDSNVLHCVIDDNQRAFAIFGTVLKSQLLKYLSNCINEATL